MQWLIEGKIAASLDGERKTPEFWYSVNYYDLLQRYGRAYFLRDDLLKLVFLPDGPPVAAKPKSARRNPRRTAVGREAVKEKMRANFLEGKNPLEQKTSEGAADYGVSEDTFIKARDELRDAGELHEHASPSKSE